MIISKIFHYLKVFNDSYSNAVIAIAMTIGAILAYLYKRTYEESKKDEGDASLIVKPIFWTFGRKYKILAVHKYEQSNSSSSGYVDKGQNSRPDQYLKLIRIESFFNLRFSIEPINEDDILIVVISRNGKERWRTIHFNQ
ncbi:hypothetical protein ACFL6H_04885 [Candidatus Latescibacterota bacterium]